MIPCVFVLVLRLVEGPGAAGGQVGGGGEDEDAQLVNEILARRSLTAERGIKLAVILLTSRGMLGKAIRSQRSHAPTLPVPRRLTRWLCRQTIPT
jgi:hypothetical protein